MYEMTMKVLNETSLEKIHSIIIHGTINYYEVFNYCGGERDTPGAGQLTQNKKLYQLHLCFITLPSQELCL